MKKLLLLISALFITSITIAQPCVAIDGFTVTSPTCNGSMDGSILVTYTAGVAPYDIQLIGPPNQSYTTSTLSQNMNGLGAGSYIVLITDNNGCQVAQPVNINQPSLIMLIGTNSTTICYGQSTQISAAAFGGTPPYTYSWTPNTFVGAGPHSVSPTTTTSYTVTVADGNGCVPATKIMTVNVTPPLAVVASSVYVCDGAATTLVPNIVSPGNGGPYTYNWSTSATTNSIVVIGSAPSGTMTTTTYTLVVGDGCTTPGAMTVFTVNASVCAGIKELNNSDFSLYPNPTNGMVQIESEALIVGIEVSDITGKSLLSEKINVTSYTLQLEQFIEGLYFVKINYANGLCITKKIAKK